MSTAAYQPDPKSPVLSVRSAAGRVANEADRLAGNAFHCGLCNEVRLASPASTGYTLLQDRRRQRTLPPECRESLFLPTQLPLFPPVASASAPNPGLAALLGLIPGVGAMYNGQYAKGVIHLIVFADSWSIWQTHTTSSACSSPDGSAIRRSRRTTRRVPAAMEHLSRTHLD